MAPIFVINLARRPDRLARISQDLDALGLAFQRVEAVDGAEFEPERLNQRFKPSSVRGPCVDAPMDARGFFET